MNKILNHKRFDFELCIGEADLIADEAAVAAANLAEVVEHVFVNLLLDFRSPTGVLAATDLLLVVVHRTFAWFGPDPGNDGAA